MNKTKATSIQAINTAIKSLTDQGTKPTQLNVSIESGLSIATIKRHWKECRLSVSPVQSDNRASDKSDRVSVPVNNVSHSTNRVSPISTPFERLKRRSSQTPTEIIPYKPWLK